MRTKRGLPAAPPPQLLIAAVLPNSDLRYLAKAARSLGLQCLIEVHSEAEMARVLELPADCLEGSMLGINNRDLGTFKVDLGITQRIMESEAGKEALRRGFLVRGTVTENVACRRCDVKSSTRATIGAPSRAGRSDWLSQIQVCVQIPRVACSAGGGRVGDLHDGAPRHDGERGVRGGAGGGVAC